MSGTAFVYTGRDNLVAMRAAVRYNAHIASLVEAHAPSSGCWLDFGAGEGQFSRLFHERGRLLLAVEADEALARINESAGVATKCSLEAVAEGSVDYVYSLNVLEHIEQDAAVLGELRRKLRPGGRIFIYVPAFQILYSSMDRLVGHHRRYSRQGLCDVLTSAGFVVRSSRYVDSLGFLASLVYKALPDRGGVVTAAQVANYDRWILPASLWLDKFLGRWLGKNLFAVAAVSEAER
jgi:SAM-dependent methyltransferase